MMTGGPPDEIFTAVYLRESNVFYLPVATFGRVDLVIISAAAGF
jgi:hypothetical protein